MKISMKELEKLFYAKDGLKEVLPALEAELERSDYYNRVMIDNLTDNAEECKKASNELSGIHGIIVKAYHFAEGALDIMEPKAKARIRKEAHAAGLKPTDGAVQAQAEDEVSEYRRVRWYLQGYVKDMDKSISTLQSILKYEGSPKGNVARSTQQP